MARAARDCPDLSRLHYAGGALEDFSAAGAAEDHGARNGVADAGGLYGAGVAGTGGRIYTAVPDCAADESLVLIATGGVGGGADLRSGRVHRPDDARDLPSQCPALDSTSGVLPSFPRNRFHSDSLSGGNNGSGRARSPKWRTGRYLGRTEVLAPVFESGTQDCAEGSGIWHGIEHDSRARIAAVADTGVGWNVVRDCAVVSRSHALLRSGCAGDSGFPASDFDVRQHVGLDAAVAGGGRRIADGYHRDSFERL